MDLFWITLANALALLLLGGLFLWSGPPFRGAVLAFPRSRTATIVLMTLSTAWFLLHLSRLGEADYGNYKHYLIAGFSIVALLSFYWAPDYLAIRGLAALWLLLAKLNLDTAYMQWAYPQRLILVGYTYFLILLALYLAVSPFRVRDFLDWAYRRASRARVFGGLLGAAGLILFAVALSY